MKNLRIRNYQLQGVLGQGAFGVVHRAFNIDTGVTVALKQIKLRGQKAENTEQEISIPESELNEILLLQRLQFNENILQYLDHFVQDGSLFIATEYVETGSLRDIISQYGKISEQFAFSVVEETLKGLAFLHAHNILHRDIKAANLLIDKNGIIKIADFGVAETFKSAENVEEVAGTPYWIAKEVLLLLCCDEKSDIWSVGATFYELLTGNPPYFDLAPPAACYKIATQGVIIGSEVSPKARAFLEKCFSEHETRPTALELLKEEFGYEEEVLKIELESFESEQNEFSDDSEDRALITSSQNYGYISGRLQIGQAAEITIDGHVMQELLFRDPSVILDSLTSVAAFNFIIDLLEFAQKQDKLELAMRKLELSGNGLVRRMIRFFNEQLECAPNAAAVENPVDEGRILRFLHLIIAAPAIYPLYIVSSFFVLLKQLFEYSVAVKSAVVELIFEIFNLQKFCLGKLKEADFSEFSRYQISQYMACSDICGDILRFVLQLNTMTIANGEFDKQLECPSGKCVHELFTAAQMNSNLILIQNATMVLGVVAQHQPLSINISQLCKLHTFYVACKKAQCSFPETILMQNLEIIHHCYGASGTLTKDDIGMLLASAAQCREAANLCVSIFQNSPQELHGNLEFYQQFKGNIAMLPVLLRANPHHRNIVKILQILERDVANTILQQINAELLVCLQIFTMSCTLAAECQKQEISEAREFAEKLAQKRLLDIIALQLARDPPPEFILPQFCALMNSSPVFCQNIVDDPTLMFGFLRNMHTSGSLIGHYLSMLKALLVVGRKKCNEKYAINQQLQILLKNANQTVKAKLHEILKQCD